MDDSLIIGDIMREEYISAHVDDDQEELSELFKKYGYLAIPVVDNEGRLVGIVTVDDILDVIEEEAEEGKASGRHFKNAMIISGFLVFIVFYTLLVLKIAGLGFGA